MQNTRIILLSILMGGILVVLNSTQGFSIPAFSRQYKTSCTTCHIAPPARNAFGEAFRRNGYVMPMSDDEFKKDEPVSLGADAWKEAFPEAVWPGVLPSSFPISAYVHQRVVVEFGEGKKGNQIEFDAPHEFELLLGGNFGESIGFLGEWVAFEKGQNAKGLKRFFIQFNDLVGPQNAFNVKFGRFEPGITDGYKDANRMTMEHVKTIDFKATGQWRPRDQQSGIELNGILNKRTNYSVGAVNGQSKTISDPTDRKDVYFRLGHKIKGMSLDGIDETGLELKTSDNMIDNTVQVGFYGYFGSIDDESYTDPIGVTHTYSRRFNRFGFDAMAGVDKLKILTGAIFGTDENVGQPGTENIDSRAWFVEGNYYIFPWMIGIARFGAAHTEQDGHELEDYTDFTPNLTLLARANVRISFEAYFKMEDSVDDKLRWFKFNTMFIF